MENNLPNTWKSFDYGQFTSALVMCYFRDRQTDALFEHCFIIVITSGGQIVYINRLGVDRRVAGHFRGSFHRADVIKRLLCHTNYYLLRTSQPTN